MTATKVDFYLLAASDGRTRLTTVCRLAEKAFDQGLRVTVRTAGPAETAELDEMLWTYTDRSFVPHAPWPADAAVAAETPILIGSGTLPESHRDVLINLDPGPLADPQRYARICEIVAGDDAAKRQARVRWRGYRDAGLNPESHNL